MSLSGSRSITTKSASRPNGIQCAFNAHAFGRDGGRGLDRFHRRHSDCDQF